MNAQVCFEHFTALAPVNLIDLETSIAKPNDHEQEVMCCSGLPYCPYPQEPAPSDYWFNINDKQ
ncbi:Uncharacterised protein [BD1-7 clade bacterium]|uniref:Uncharacterized protein n=1 Tax=BD1-7 clade bacterium TaxID=2029982 RepID=A0A5S9PXD1_9GAMM|nr:Uncharacterised protein [BD1-7 clade bacterium]CAA0109017.1 Uncharacterised protein [BD1-7 clade bacterium]CAA0124283.1 Uncharacterised protein [BD1-7 clade bacterium]